MRVKIIVEDGPPQLRVLPVETTVGIDPRPEDVVEVPDTLMKARRTLLEQLEEIDEVILEEHAPKHTRQELADRYRRHGRDKTPDEHRPILQSQAFWLIVVAAVFSTLSALVTSYFSPDPAPPPGPSSGRASLILQDIPSPANDWTLRMTGSGWEGDNSVELTYPTDHGGTETTEVPLHPEKKLLDHEVVAVNLPAGEYTVKARGVQSGTELTEAFTVP